MSDKKTATQPSLNDQLTQLDDLVAWFDQDGLDLDQALAKFEQGAQLTQAIRTQLEGYENKITVLKQRFDTPNE